MKTRVSTKDTGGIDYIIKFGDNTYFGVEDLIRNANVEGFTTVDEETGEVINTYEFLWSYMQDVMDKVYGVDEEFTLEEMESLEKYAVDYYGKETEDEN